MAHPATEQVALSGQQAIRAAEPNLRFRDVLPVLRWGCNGWNVASGTTGACTVVITINGATGLTAPNGWVCHAEDLTTPANLISQSACATTCTVTGTTVSGDTISFLAMGF